MLSTPRESEATARPCHPAEVPVGIGKLFYQPDRVVLCHQMGNSLPLVGKPASAIRRHYL